ncbi:MAG TPA: thioredoxin [Candidatus Cloacimonadota bacterium]|mgnify:CR=1 FL=1|nr:thioredoxin [Candidatus Cloacimonadota bacterium]HPT71152.1 thioredoxin [Candidatus Cloacimonadota bacterium]
MATIQVNEGTFEREVVKSTVPVLVDFWAPWCMPCKALMPTVEGIASEMGDRIKVAKINIDESPQLANQFSIMSIPTLLIFHQGKVAEQIVGTPSKDKILAKVNQYL